MQFKFDANQSFQVRRVFDEQLNILTVVANESYEHYVSTLQAEMEEEFGREGAAPRPVNARLRSQVRRRADFDITPEFKALWERIRQKTRYQVTVDSEKLVEDVVGALDRTQFEPPRVVVTRAAVDARQDMYTARIMSMNKPVANLAGRFPLPNLVEMMADLMEHTTPPVRLCRRTLLEIIRRTQKKKAALDNPQDFATKAVQVIKEKVAHQLIHGIQYEKIEKWFLMEQWQAEIDSVTDRMVPVTKSIYDYVVCDSLTERQFVEKLERMDAVKFFLKLPNWFKVKTPICYYNPDWAIVMEERDQFGEAGPTLYLVRETKSAPTGPQLREAENQKIHCGEKHFKGALGVDFKVARSADELP